MRAEEGSRSALVVSLMRAVHGGRDEEPLVRDPYGLALIGREERAQLCRALAARLGVPAPAMEGAQEESDLASVLRVYPGYGNVMIRTRYTEDRLDEAVKSGLGQYVIVGAGMDSFCLRRPELRTALTIFEIDHPATQAQKLQRFSAAGLEVPHNVTYLAADLERSTIAETLRGSRFDPERSAFFSWLGVSPYLSEAANVRAIQSMAECTAPNGELVFNYLSANAAAAGPTGVVISRSNEPILSRLEPGSVGAHLRQAGFDALEDIGATETVARYCQGRRDALRPTANFRLVHARRRGRSP